MKRNTHGLPGKVTNKKLSRQEFNKLVLCYGKENIHLEILGISRPLILTFKTTFPIFKTTKCGQDHTKIGTGTESFSTRNLTIP